MSRIPHILALSVLAASAASMAGCSRSRGEEERSEEPAGTSAPGEETSAGEGAFPLQAWMKANGAAALRAEDFGRLAQFFARTSELGPPGDPAFAGWQQAANKGLVASRGHDLDGARAACAGCHDTFRSEYKTRHRARPLPTIRPKP